MNTVDAKTAPGGVTNLPSVRHKAVCHPPGAVPYFIPALLKLRRRIRLSVGRAVFVQSAHDLLCIRT